MSDARSSDASVAGASPDSLLSRLNLGWSRRRPVILQTEAAECGLACLAMVAGAHGQRWMLGELRDRFAVSLTPVDGHPGWHRCHLRVVPHLTHLGRPLTLELIGRLDLGPR